MVSPLSHTPLPHDPTAPPQSTGHVAAVSGGVQILSPHPLEAMQSNGHVAPFSPRFWGDGCKCTLRRMMRD